MDGGDWESIGSQSDALSVDIPVFDDHEISGGQEEEEKVITNE